MKTHVMLIISFLCFGYYVSFGQSTIIYDFESDIADTFAQTPPANKVYIPSGNGATAGVSSLYNDYRSSPSAKETKAFRPYTDGTRNQTGVATLSKFPTTATNYSVTWRSFNYLSSDLYQHEDGVLLRGTAPSAGLTKGFSCGLMQGYLFMYHKRNLTFNIYKPVNSKTYLPLLCCSTHVTVIEGHTYLPEWFRASVTGSSSVLLKFESSYDSKNWTTVLTYTDSISPFTQGSTQLVWRFFDYYENIYYLDDITFNGYSAAPTGTDDVLEDSEDCVSTEFFSIDGTKLKDIKHLKGLFLVRKTMSNGEVKTFKYSMK